MLTSFILGGALSSVFNFLKILFILCEGCLKEKKYGFWMSKKYEYDTAFRNVLVHQWSLKIKTNMIYL